MPTISRRDPNHYGSVYFIHNSISNTVYVGITTSIPFHRWGKHLGGLRHNKSDNPYLQAAWNKYGESAFEFVVIEEHETISDLNQAECFWIEYLRYCGARVYNLKSGGGFGGQPSLETRQKISNARKGHIVSDETRRRIGDRNRGKKHSENSRQQMSRSHTGVALPREQVKRISDANRGKKRSDEVLERQRRAHEKLHGNTYQFYSPQGEVITTNGIPGFSRKYGLDEDTVYQIVKGASWQHKGWRLCRDGHPVYKYTLLSPEDEMIGADSIPAFCKAHGYGYGVFRQKVIVEQGEWNGWRLHHKEK